MQVDDLGLESILHRDRLFLIDTNVLFGEVTGGNRIEDGGNRLAAQLAHDHERFEYMQQIYDAIRVHDNVRITTAVYREMLRKLGGFHQSYRDRAKIRKIIEVMDQYLRHHRLKLVVGRDYWNKTPMAVTGYTLMTKVAEQHPEIHELSWEDVSLLVGALEIKLDGNGTYSPVDIISSDYGVKVGAEVMFDMVENLPAGTPKQRRALRHQCLKVIAREHGGQYQEVFNSNVYCAHHKPILT